jgi:hypothetical protein
MKHRITLDIEITDNVYRIAQASMIPISDETPVNADTQGKQTPMPIPEIPQRVPIPAPVGQTPTTGKGDWFAGTTWG